MKPTSEFVPGQQVRVMYRYWEPRTISFLKSSYWGTVLRGPRPQGDYLVEIKWANTGEMLNVFIPGEDMEAR